MMRLTFWLLLIVLLQSPLGYSPAEEQAWSGTRVIVLDPGHGGHDPGAVGPSGLTEKEVTLSLALKIKERLSGTTDEVYLTRDGDYGVDLDHRTELANEHRADVFVSIHAGGAFAQSARGAVIFYSGPGSGLKSPPAAQTHEAWKGQEEPCPWDDLWIRHAAENRVLAHLVHRYLVGESVPETTGVYEAPVFVLRGADMPAVLVEIGYLPRPDEEAALGKPEVLDAKAEAIGSAIREYLGMVGR
jgi:N-acetylmuramoyl-L-alanine amidase